METMKRKTSRLRLSPNEEARIIREELERRRKMRIQQVREQQRLIALQIRREVEERRRQELQQLEAELRKDWVRAHSEKLHMLQSLYQESLQLLGQSHRNAKENEPDLAAIPQRETENRCKAAERHREALKELKSLKQQNYERQNHSINARKRALQVEKERSARVASLPPPPPDPLQTVDTKKPHVVRRSDISAFGSTHYHMPDCTVDREMDTVQPDANVEAELEAKRLTELKKEAETKRREQLEKARLRGRQALRREQMVQDRDRLLVELEHLQQSDLLRRRQQVALMPPQIFQPLHQRQEAKQDFQREMEFAFEDMYTGERRVKGDLVVRLEPEPLPAESPGSQDQELDVTLDDVSTTETENIQQEAEDQSGGTEPSAGVLHAEPAPRRALKRLLDRIRTQRNQLTDVGCRAAAADDSPSDVRDQIPERDSTIETGSLLGVGKRQPSQDQLSELISNTCSDHGGPAIEMSKPPPPADIPDVLTVRMPEFEEDQKKKEVELQREKQQQVALLQELEEQKARLEQMLQEAQLERERLQAAVTKETPCGQSEEPSLLQESVSSELVPDEDEHTSRIRKYQQRLLQQNRDHQRSVEVARQRLDEYQRALRLRHSMAPASAPLTVTPSDFARPALRSVLPAPSFLPVNTPHTCADEPTKLPQPSAARHAELPQDKMEPSSSGVRNTRSEVTARLTDRIMDRVTEHLPERLRPSSVRPSRPLTEPQPPPSHPPHDLLQHAPPPAPHQEEVLLQGHLGTQTVQELLRRMVKQRQLEEEQRRREEMMRREEEEVQRDEMRRRQEEEVQREEMRRRQEEEVQREIRRRQEREEMRRRQEEEVQREEMRRRQEEEVQREEMRRRQEEEVQREEMRRHQEKVEEMKRLLEELQIRRHQEQEVQREKMRKQEEEMKRHHEEQGEMTRRQEEVQRDQMRRQKEALEALLSADDPSRSVPESQMSETFSQSRLQLLSSLLKAIEESHGGTLAHLEVPEETEMSPPLLDSSRTVSVRQSDRPPSGFLPPSGLLPPPRAPKPPVTRVRPSLLDMADQHELSAIQEVETPLNISLLPGVEDGAGLPDNVEEGSDASMVSAAGLQCVSEETPGSSGRSSERSSQLTRGEGLQSVESTPTGSSRSSNIDSLLRMISPVSSDSGRGADVPAAGCRSLSKSPLRGADSASSSSSISTGSYVTTDPEHNAAVTDKSIQRQQGSDADLPDDSSPCGRSFSSAGVDSVFNDSSIQQIIDRYTKELNISLCTAGTTTDSEASTLDDIQSSVSQPSLTRLSDGRNENQSSAAPRSEPLAGAQSGRMDYEESFRTVVDDSFQPLIGQLTERSSYLDGAESSWERLVGQPSAHSSMIGPDQDPWDLALSRLIGRLSLQSDAAHKPSSGRDLQDGPMATEPSAAWINEAPDENQMKPLVGEPDESAAPLSGNSDESSHASLGVSFPPEASSRHTCVVSTADVPLLAAEGCESFHSLQAEVTHNETAEVSMTFDLPKRSDSPEGRAAAAAGGAVSSPSDAAEESPERLREDESSGRQAPSLHQSFSRLLDSSADVDQTDVMLDSTTCDDTAPPADQNTEREPDPSTDGNGKWQDSDPKRDVWHQLLGAGGERGILEQSDITLLSLTDTTLQDQDTTVTDQDTQEAELQVSLKHDASQSAGSVLEIQWGPVSLHDVQQQKLRSLAQRSKRRADTLKAKAAAGKAETEVETSSSSTECRLTEKAAAVLQTERLPPPAGRSVCQKEVKTLTAEQKRREQSEMRQRTQRLYDQLEEVKQLKAVRTRQQDYAKNRLKAKEFHQKTLQKLRAKRP